jgi:hypothetical protein
LLRVFVPRQSFVVVYADDDGARGPELFHTRVSQLSQARILLQNAGVWRANQVLHLEVREDASPRNTFEEATDPLLVDNTGRLMRVAVNLHFISSTTVEDSEFYARNCTTSQFEENRTDLPADCRCNSALTGGLPICFAPGESYPLGFEFGAGGPRLADVNNVGREVGGGFIDELTNEYILAMNWKDAVFTQSVGVIWAIDVDTGARRVVAGTIDTPNGYETTGAGYDSNVTVSGVVRHAASLPFLWDVQRGPDGDWYSYASDTADNVEIVRIDPATGDRTLVWRKDVDGQVFGMPQCASDRVGELSVQFTEKSFAMDPAGNFYLTFHNPSDGDGIVRIPADGSACDVVMRVNSTSGDIGTGFSIQSQNIRGMAFFDETIYIYTILGDRLIAVDPATGNRTLVSSVEDQLGSGHPSIGENWLIFDDATGLLFTSGGAADQFVVVDLATGDRQNLLQLSTASPLIPGGHPVPHEVRGPLEPGTWSRERFYFRPGNPDHIGMAINGMSFGIYEIHTSNSFMFSL